MILKHDLKKADAVQYIQITFQQTGCKYFEKEGQMSLYFKKEDQYVPTLLTWLPQSITRAPQSGCIPSVFNHHIEFSCDQDEASRLCHILTVYQVWLRSVKGCSVQSGQKVVTDGKSNFDIDLDPMTFKVYRLLDLAIY